MVGENFKIYGVRITGKCISRVKKLNLDIFIYAHPTPRQSSPPGSYHHPQVEGNDNTNFPQAAFFRKSVPLSRKGGVNLWLLPLLPRNKS